jgi:hypothetical protein
MIRFMRFSPTPWLVAALAFLILGFTRGLHSSFGVFLVALLDAFVGAVALPRAFFPWL